MKKILLTITVLATTSSFAVDTAACAACHGKDFEKKAMNVSKIVKDMSKADIITALKGYKNDSYGGAMKGVMKGQVAKLSDADIDAIASQITGANTEASKEDANKTMANQVVDAVKTGASAVADQAVNAAKSKATEAVTDAVTNAIK